MNLLLVQHRSWRRARLSAPVFTQVKGLYESMLAERGSALSMAVLMAAAALSATSSAERWEGPRPVKATSTNCVIDHGGGR